MPKIQVYDAPICYPIGVGDAGADPALLQFAADLEWLAAQGVTVERYNPRDHPEAFAGDEIARFLSSGVGADCLPVISIDGSIASCGGYASRQELAALAGLVTISRPDSDRPLSAFKVVRNKCCEGTLGICKDGTGG